MSEAAVEEVRAYLERCHTEGALMPSTTPKKVHLYINKSTGELVPALINPADTRSDLTEGAISALVGDANAGDRDAALQLSSTHKQNIMCGNSSPHALAEYIAGILESGLPKRPRGKPPTNFNRDGCILCAVNIAVQHGVCATRNEATAGTQSGCSIVAEGLQRLGIEISALGVESIWRRNRQLREAIARVAK